MKNENSSKSIPWIVVAIMTLVLLWLVFERVRLSSENDEFRTELQTIQSDKEKVKTELADMLVEYESLKTNNAQINEDLKKEREKIEQLLEEIQKVKSGNSLAIARYKREIKTLREVMKSFVRQIDSLNTQNQELKQQVNQTNEKYQQTLTQKNQLSSKTDSLSKQVSAAEAMVAEGIVITPLNSRNNSTTRASKAKKIQIDFNLRDNAVATRGNKMIYIRIFHTVDLGLDEVLSNNYQSGLFDFFDSKNSLQNAGYTATNTISYDGNKTPSTIYFDFPAEPAKDTYTVEIYVGRKLAGRSSFQLK
ncbi:MAG: hypothetical protein RIS47_1810 [Bacteroidota bacterium]|jgi:uncharacterized protein YlxW (UPF0749 family)